MKDILRGLIRTRLAGWLGVFLTVLLAVLAAGLLVAAVPVFGNKALIVRSGSMSPEIEAGDLVVVRPNAGRGSGYEEGEVVAFRTGGGDGAIVMHRVVNKEKVGQGFSYTTKGDANDEPDGDGVLSKDIIGRKIFTAPYIGRFLALGKTRAGLLAFIIIPSVLVIIGDVWSIVKEVRRGSRRHSVVRSGLRMDEVENIETKGDAFVLGGRRAPVRVRVDSVMMKTLLLIMSVSVIIPSGLSLYTDSELSGNNVLVAASDFGISPEPSPTASLEPSPSESPALLADHLVISEVQIKGDVPGPATKDFIEIYNPTDSDVDLTGWKLRKKNANGNEESVAARGFEGEMIAAHGFFLWANSKNNFAESVGADIATSEILSENNSVALINAANEIVDQVAWGNTANSQFGEGIAFNPSPDVLESLERKALPGSSAEDMGIGGADEFKGNGHDSDNNASDFILRDLPNPQSSSSDKESL